MSNPFGNLSNDGLEEAQDRLGGGFAARDSDIYTTKIKLLYAIKSQGGAQGAVLVLASGDLGDSEYKETVYVTNKQGENFFLNKQDPTKKVPLPGYTIINDICLATVQKELKDVVFEEKVVNIYDSEQQKEIPKSVPVATELLGQEVSVAILKTLENQQEKVNGEYVNKADGSTRETNNIDKVFNTASKMTIAEAKGGATEPQFWDKWVEKNKGQTRDKVAKATGGASSGAPQAGNGGNAAPRNSLFGNKA